MHVKYTLLVFKFKTLVLNLGFFFSSVFEGGKEERYSNMSHGTNNSLYQVGESQLTG